MVWFRIDDGFPGHPKLDALLPDPVRWSRALAVWVVAGCYASRYTTDGRVTAARVARECAAGVDVKAGIADLVEIGLLERRENGDLWLHNFTRYNPTSKDVEAKREADRVRQKRSRARKHEQKQDPVTPPSHRDSPVTVTPPSITPSPTQPDPARPDPCSPTGGVSAVADKRARDHVGAQRGAAATRWLNQRLGKRFDQASKIARAAGRRWLKAGWSPETVQAALDLRVTEGERLGNHAYLTPGTLFNTKLDKYVEKHQAGITPQQMRLESRAGKQSGPTVGWSRPASHEEHEQAQREDKPF